MTQRIEPTELSYRDFLGTFTVEEGHTFVQGPLTELHIKHVETYNPVIPRYESHVEVEIRLGKYEFSFDPTTRDVTLYRGRVEQ